jgi:hypothetical protein
MWDLHVLLCLSYVSVNFSVIPFSLQSVPVHSADCVKTYTVSCRGVLSSAHLYLIGSGPVVVFPFLLNGYRNSVDGI